MRRLTTCCLCAAIAAAPTSADELVGEVNSAANIGIFGAFDSVEITAFLSPNFGVFSGEGTLFEDTIFQDGDDRTDEVTFGDDPHFPRYVELITDGLDWYYYDELAFPDGITQHGQFGFESQRLPIGNDPFPPGGGPDLQGYDITRVIRDVSIDMQSPGTDPNGDGNWTDVQYSIRTSIYAVPEPATGVLVSLLATLLARTRR